MVNANGRLPADAVKGRVARIVDGPLTAPILSNARNSITRGAVLADKLSVLACGGRRLSLGLLSTKAVQIKGLNFRPDIGYRVYFGNRRATSVTVIDPETLLVVTPERQESGDVDIFVLADNGPAFSVAGGFAYVDMSDAAEAAQKTKGNLAF